MKTSATGSSQAFGLRLLAVIAVGSVMVLLDIGSEPFWRDEVASVSVAGRSFGGVLDVLADTDANNGLYYLLLHGWMWGGESEGWVRALSALFALATIPATALLARRLFGDAVGLLAGLLSGANLFIVAYAQEARQYALGLFLTTLATLLFVEAARRRRPALYGAYALVSVLAVYANLFSALVLLTHLVSLAFLPRKRGLVRPFAVTQAIVFVATAPLAAFLLATGNDQISWVGRPGLTTVRDFAYAVTGNRQLAIVYGLLIAIGLAAGWRRSATAGPPPEDGRWRYFLVFAWLVLPAAVLLAVSLRKPLFVDRYLIGSAPALAILAAVGLVELARRSRVAAVGAATILVCLSILARIELADDPGEEDLRAAARMVARESQPTDGLAYAPAFARTGMRWYLRREAGSASPTDLAVARRGSAEQVGDLYATEVAASAVVTRLRRYRRVWLIGYPNGTGGNGYRPTPEPMLQAGNAVLQREYRRIRSRGFGGLQVELYQRQRGDP